MLIATAIVIWLTTLIPFAGGIIHLIIKLPNHLNENNKSLLIRAIEAGFDFNIRDNEGMLPLDYAYQSGDNNLVNILKQYYTKFGIEIKENKNIIKSEKK